MFLQHDALTCQTSTWLISSRDSHNKTNVADDANMGNTPD